MYPSILDTFNRPSPTDRLNSPSHSALHNTVSSALGQVQAVIGLSTTSTVGTLFYDIRSPDSNGGGHVQTANKGGTGQTTFNKGDLLVAQSNSVLTKLGVSSTLNELLIADPSQAVGMKWGTSPNANKVAINTTSVASSATLDSDIVLFSTSILGGTLGTSNAVKYRGLIQNFAAGSSQSFTLKAKYGNGVVGTISATTTTLGSVMSGMIDGVFTSTGVSSQIGYIYFDANTRHGNANGVESGQFLRLVNTSTSSVNALVDQNLIITGNWGSDGNPRMSVLTGIFTVEKIA